ncbi:MAG: tetratricopeptide repeat protein [Alphaproteobacteria bacterium]|nr:tetratricopeptide repeat protein [Alphaproteobacteria bacterium]
MNLNELYREKLATVNGVHFTSREIDIVACIANGRTSKKTIADTLNISPRTVETHTRNITHKINRGSWENIRNFFEDHNILCVLREYYDLLVLDVIFHKTIQKISSLLQKDIFCLVHFDKSIDLSLIKQLREYLGCSGIKLLTQDEADKNSLHNQDSLNYQTIQIDDILKKTSQISTDQSKQAYLLTFEIIKIFSEKNEVRELINAFIKDVTPEKDLLNPISLKPHSVRFPKFVFFQQYKFLLCCLCIFFSVFLVYKLRPKESLKTTIRYEFQIPHWNNILERESLIHEIQNQLLITENKDIHTITIHGISGSGKTTIARIIGQKQTNISVLEVNGSSIKHIKKSFFDIANVLAKTPDQKIELQNMKKAKTVDEQDQNILRFVQNELKNSAPWLLIYDDVESIKILEDYFPKSISIWGVGHVIITTKNKNIKTSYSIDVKELSESEKKELFVDVLGNKTRYNQEELSALLKVIPPFPLDISIAAHYIANTGISFSQYLSRMKINNFDRTQKIMMSDITGYDKTRKEIASMAIESICSENSKFEFLFSILGIIDFQNIPRSLIDFCFDKITTDNFLYSLNKNSLLTAEKSDQKNSTFNIHSSIHEIILDFFNTKHPENRTLEKESINKFILYLDELILHEDFFQMTAILPHVLNLLEKKDLSLVTIALLNSKLAIIQSHLGADVLDIVTALNTALLALKKDPVRNKTHIAQSLLYLGEAYKKLGNYTLAIKILEDCVNINKQIGDTQNICQAQAMTYLGTIHRILGQYDIAKEQLLCSQNIYKKMPQRYSAESQNYVYLGLTYKDLGHFALSLQTLEKSLSFWDGDHKDPMWHAWCSMYLASVLNEIGEYNNAEKIIKESIDRHKKSVNSKIWLAWADTVLGQTYYGLKRYEEAKSLLEKSKKTYEIKHTNNYIYYNMLLPTLGEVYIELNQINEALGILELSLDLSKKNYGDNHIRLAGIMNSLGKVYDKLGDFDKAELFMMDALNIYVKYDHIERYKSYESLSSLYQNKSNTFIDEPSKRIYFENKSKEFIQKAYDTISKNFSPESQHYIRISNKISRFKI